MDVARDTNTEVYSNFKPFIIRFLRPVLLIN